MIATYTIVADTREGYERTDLLERMCMAVEGTILAADVSSLPEDEPGDRLHVFGELVEDNPDVRMVTIACTKRELRQTMQIAKWRMEG